MCVRRTQRRAPALALRMRGRKLYMLSFKSCAIEELAEDCLPESITWYAPIHPLTPLPFHVCDVSVQADSYGQPAARSAFVDGQADTPAQAHARRCVRCANP
jgi:hypothetical protein